MFILFISLFNLLFSQIVDHQFESEIFSGNPYEVKVYSDINPNDIGKFNIYYRTNTSGLYLQGTLNNVTSNYFSYTIPLDFIFGEYLEYYILLESNDGVIKTIPQIDPYDIPISLRISDENIFIEEFQNNGLENNINIISPQPNQIVSPDDVFVALSYFRMSDIDESRTQVILDDVNITSSADIYSTNLTLIPNIKSSGKHQIKVILYNTSGEQYNPVIWNFYIESLDYIYTTSKKLSGKFSNDYLNNNVDRINSYSNSTNFDLEYESNWINIKSKLKKSSLENYLMQPKDRYNINLSLNNINIDYGDFYPNFNDFFISGSRVRGLGFNYKSKFFQLDLISGELARAVQGDLNNDAVLISDLSSNYICPDIECNEGYDQNSISISRSGYTFKRDIDGLRIGLGRSDRINFGFNILKAKDQVNSVDKSLANAIISLPYDYEIFQKFNSDIFVDLNNDGEYNQNEPIYEDGINPFAIDGAWNFDDEGDIPSEFKDTSYSLELQTIQNSIYIEDCEETYIENDWENDITTCEDDTTYPLIQYVWDIKVSTANFEDYMDTYFDITESTDISEIININFLEKEWSGSKPQDNIVLGTDFSMSSKNNNLRMNSTFAMSLINGNIWNPVKSVNDFDTYSDDHTDCEFGTTYSNLEFSENYSHPDLLLPTLTTGVDCTDGNCTPGDHYWSNCEAYIYNIDGFPDIPIDLTILVQGVPLDAIPNPEDFADIFHYNFDAIPSIPFYSIIQKLSATGICNLGTCGQGHEYVEEINCEEETWSPLEDEGACSANEGEWIDESESFMLSDLLNSPEVAYDIDFSLKLLNNQIKFGIKQVGQSFNSLGNPYLQKDMRETYFSDRIRLFENRMFVALKMSDIKNGISDISNSDISKKYDFNVSYYPGINYPSFNISFANYSRKSGEQSQGYEIINWIPATEDVGSSGSCVNNTEATVEEDCPNNISGIFDTRLNTQTNNFNFSVNHSFESTGRIINFIKSKISSIENINREKIYQQNMTFTYFSSSKNDLMFPIRGYLNELDVDAIDPDYLSPRSRNINFGINLKTTFSHQWESNVNYSNSYFDYAQKNSDYFEKQRINTLSSSFNYKVNHKIKNVGLGVDYISGIGTRNYNQFTLKIHSELLLIQNMNLNIMYNYKIKNSVSSGDYINSLFKINISYRF